MPKFKVELTRIATSTLFISVNAKDEKEVKRICSEYANDLFEYVLDYGLDTTEPDYDYEALLLSDEVDGDEPSFTVENDKIVELI
jgi:hypothetical protein